MSQSTQFPDPSKYLGFLVAESLRQLEHPDFRAEVQVAQPEKQFIQEPELIMVPMGQFEDTFEYLPEALTVVSSGTGFVSQLQYWFVPKLLSTQLSLPEVSQSRHIYCPKPATSTLHLF